MLEATFKEKSNQRYSSFHHILTLNLLNLMGGQSVSNVERLEENGGYSERNECVFFLPETKNKKKDAAGYRASSPQTLRQERTGALSFNQGFGGIPDRRPGRQDAASGGVLKPSAYY